MKRGLKYVLAFFSALILLAVGMLTTTFINSGQRTAESYAAYSAYLDAGRTGNSHDFGDGNGLMLILDHSSTGMFRVLVPIHSAAYPASAKLDMALRNLLSRRIERRFSLGGTYKLIPTTDTSNLPESEIRASYGVMTLSQVTFNHDRSWAVFYAEHLCGLCGGGEFVTMRKVDGKWIVMSEDGTWIS